MFLLTLRKIMIFFIFCKFKLGIYKRYIDDTFLLFKTAAHFPKFLQYSSSKHSFMKFTCDVKLYSNAGFLDILIHKY